MNAADFGVPQVRQRLIFVGVKKGRNLKSEYQFPIGQFKNQYRTVSDAISDLPLRNMQKHQLLKYILLELPWELVKNIMNIKMLQQY